MKNQTKNKWIIGTVATIAGTIVFFSMSEKNTKQTTWDTAGNVVALFLCSALFVGLPWGALYAREWPFKKELEQGEESESSTPTN